MKTRKWLGELAILVAIVTMAALFVFPAFADENEKYIYGQRSFIPDGFSDRVMHYHLKHNVWKQDSGSQFDEEISFYQEWMKHINSYRRLNEINIPAAHDAGMKDPEGLGAKSVAEKYARTQGLFIDEQLFWGVRYFDIRLYHKREYKKGLGLEQWDDHENLWVLHGKNESFRYWGQNHDDHDTSLHLVLTWVKDFLEEHPSEAVILHFRPETNDGEQKDIIMGRLVTILHEELLNETNPKTGKPYLYTFIDNKDYPLLGDCRGQVVVRCSNDYRLQLSSNGCLAFDPEDDRFKNDFQEQDHSGWSATSKTDWAEGKYKNNWWFDLTKDITHFKQLNIAWLSTVGMTDVFGIPERTPKDTSDQINGKLFGDGKLFDTHMKYLGWVGMDFVSNEMSKYIFMSNFFADDDCCTITVKSGRPGPDDITDLYPVKKGTKITIPSDIYDYDREAMNSYLIGWKTGDGVFYQPGTSFDVTEDVTFTGEWASELYTPLRIEWNDIHDTDEIRPESVTVRYTTQSGDSGSVTLSAAQMRPISDPTEEEAAGSQNESDLETWEMMMPWDTTGIEAVVSSSETWFIPGEDGKGKDQEGEYSCGKSGEEGKEWKLTFTHLHIMKKISISGQIIWHDGDNKDELRPASVTIRLLRNGIVMETDDAGNPVEPKTISAENDWTFDFGNWLLYHDQGKKYDFHVEESGDFERYAVQYDGFNVINIHNPESKIPSAGTVNWDDDGNRDRVRPDRITLSLYQRNVLQGTVPAEGPGWEYDFGKDFPEFEGGEKIPYRVESDTPEYTAGIGEEDYRITLRHSPVTRDVSGRILWADNEDADGSRPESVVVRLFANGTEIDSQTVKARQYSEGETGEGESGGSEAGEGEASEDESAGDKSVEWIWGFGEVYKYRDGAEISYTVTQDSVEGYLTVYDPASGEILNTKQPVVALDFGEGREALAAAYKEAYSGPEPCDADGCSVLLYVENGATVRPPDPVLAGYAFKGWYPVTETGMPADAPFDFSAPITKTVALKAVWTVTVSCVDAKGMAMDPVEARPVFSDTRYWNSGWYAVTEDVAIEGRVSMTGAVNLILCDGKTLNVNNSGISVLEDGSLTVWAQTNGTGALKAAGKSYCAGIGGEYKTGAGTVVIHGGMVSAEGGHNAAAIGGGYTGGSGTITIDGGNVTATGGSSSAGIGGGYTGDGDVITVSGGTVKATGGSGSGAGIGGGYKGDGGTISLSGGDLTVSSVGAGISLAIGGAAPSADIVMTYEKNAHMRVTAGSYDGTVNLLKPFAAENGEEIRVFEAGKYSEEGAADPAGWPEDLAGKTLMSVFTVAFDSDGGREVEPQVFLCVNDSGKALKPDDITKLKYAFMGWYPVTETGALAEEAFNFDTIITEDVVLKAKWDGSLILTLPKGTKSIAANAFADTGVTIVEVNDACASIGDGAFANCNQLQQIRIPKDCVFGENEENPFRNCEGVIYIYSTADNAAAQAFCEAHDENCKFVAEKTDEVGP